MVFGDIDSKKKNLWIGIIYPHRIFDYGILALCKNVAIAIDVEAIISRDIPKQFLLNNLRWGSINPTN